MKTLTLRGLTFDSKKINPKVFARAAELVLEKMPSTSNEYYTSCYAIQKACQEFYEDDSYENGWYYKRLFSSLYQPSDHEYEKFISHQFHEHEVGVVYYWGNVDRVRNQKCRSMALLLAAEIVKDLQ